MVSQWNVCSGSPRLSKLIWSLVFLVCQIRVHVAGVWQVSQWSVGGGNSVPLWVMSYGRAERQNATWAVGR